MPTRYSDLDATSNGAKDFVIRRRSPTVIQMGLIFLCTLISAVGISLQSNDKTLLILVLFLLFSLLCWYVVIQLQRRNDLVMTTEFQNALFASALGINNKFSLIIKRDGNIVYLDRSFQDMFPDFVKLPRRSIDALLEHGKVSSEDINRIFAAIQDGSFAKIVFDIRSSDGQINRIVMSIEPILRPSGFILLRGREYIEKRAENEIEGTDTVSPLNKSNVTLLSYIVDNIDLGVYLTDPMGQLLYANEKLAEWLGFGINEMLSSNLTLQDIYWQPAGRSDTIIPDDFEGEVTLQKRSGETFRAHIHQKVIRDPQGKIMGSTAVVNPVSAGDVAGDVKKKTW